MSGRAGFTSLAILDAVVAALTLPMASAAAAPEAGTCLVAVQQNAHVLKRQINTVAPLNGAKLDYISAEAYVRDLDNCLGAGFGQSLGSAVLPANLEDTNGGTSYIYQLGWKDSFFGGLQFVYAYQSDSQIAWGQSNLAIVTGHQYKFEIELTTPGSSVIYRITDLNTGEVSQKFVGSAPASVSDWPTDAWWGCERLDSQSGIGNDEAHGNIDIHQMKFSGTNGTTKYQYDGMPWQNASTGPERIGPLDSNHHMHIKQVAGTGDQHNAINCDTLQ